MSAENLALSIELEQKGRKEAIATKFRSHYEVVFNDPIGRVFFQSYLKEKLTGENVILFNQLENLIMCYGHPKITGRVALETTDTFLIEAFKSIYHDSLEKNAKYWTNLPSGLIDLAKTFFDTVLREEADVKSDKELTTYYNERLRVFYSRNDSEYPNPALNLLLKKTHTPEGEEGVEELGLFCVVRNELWLLLHNEPYRLFQNSPFFDQLVEEVAALDIPVENIGRDPFPVISPDMVKLREKLYEFVEMIKEYLEKFKSKNAKAGLPKTLFNNSISTRATLLFKNLSRLNSEIFKMVDFKEHLEKFKELLRKESYSFRDEELIQAKINAFIKFIEDLQLKLEGLVFYSPQTSSPKTSPKTSPRATETSPMASPQSSTTSTPSPLLQRFRNLFVSTPSEEIDPLPQRVPSPPRPASSRSLANSLSLSPSFPTPDSSLSGRLPSPSTSQQPFSAESSANLRSPSPSGQSSLPSSKATLRDPSPSVRTSPLSSATHVRTFLPSLWPSPTSGPLANLRGPSPSIQPVASASSANLRSPSPSREPVPGGSLPRGRILSPSLRQSSAGISITLQNESVLGIHPAPAPKDSPRSRSQSLILISKTQKLHTGITRKPIISTGIDAQGPIIFTDMGSGSVSDSVFVEVEDSEHTKEKDTRLKAPAPSSSSMSPSKSSADMAAKPPISSKPRSKTPKAKG